MVKVLTDPGKQGYMKQLLLIALSVGIVAQPADVSAQLLYNGIPDAQEYLEFISGSGVGSGGVQVGPYLGRFDENPLAPAFNIYCVDYLHFAKSQDVNVTSLTAADLGATRLGSADTYRRLAYLSSLFHENPTSEWGQIHRAIWNVSSNAGLSNTGGYQNLSVPVTFAANDWYVLTPTYPGSPNSGQEFLMRRVSVPEPATFLLIGTGLLLLAAFSRKRLMQLGRQEL